MQQLRLFIASQLSTTENSIFSAAVWSHINHKGKRATCCRQWLTPPLKPQKSAASTAAKQRGKMEKKNRIVARRGQAVVIVKTKPHNAFAGENHRVWARPSN